MSPHDERPPLLTLGICLLALNDLLVLGACAVFGMLGSVLVVLGSWSSGEVAITVLVAAMIALVLATLATLAMASLAVCAMAWRGSRTWVATLVFVALVNCIVLVPNPVGVLAAVFCVIGGLQYLDRETPEAKIEVAQTAPASDQHREDTEGSKPTP